MLVQPDTTPHLLIVNGHIELMGDRVSTRFRRRGRRLGVDTVPHAALRKPLIEALYRRYIDDIETANPDAHL
jgi:hypothetical protein